MDDYVIVITSKNVPAWYNPKWIIQVRHLSFKDNRLLALYDKRIISNHLSLIQLYFMGSN